MALPAWSVHREAVKDGEQKLHGNPSLRFYCAKVNGARPNPNFAKARRSSLGAAAQYGSSAF